MSAQARETVRRLAAPDIAARKGGDPLATQAAGAFAVVIAGVAEGLGREIIQRLSVPTIGIGASAQCDGQILVVDDMLGMFEWTPRFVRRYAHLRDALGEAARAYAEDVRARRFPAEVETYYAGRAG